MSQRAPRIADISVSVAGQSSQSTHSWPRILTRINMLIMAVVKDLTKPTRKYVLYMIMGGGLNYHNLRGDFKVALGGIGWGMGLKRWIGDSFFVAPEFRIGREPLARISLPFGFGRRT